MNQGGVPVLDKTIQDTNLLLNDIADSCGFGDDSVKAYALLRAVLHTLRLGLSTQEIAQLGARLPVFIRGLYYENWSPAAEPVSFDENEFYAIVKDQFNQHSAKPISELVQHTLRTLSHYLSQGEWNDIKSVLQQELVHALKF